VKGRAERFEYEQQSTRHGPVIGIDRERNLAYAMKWPSGVPGMAAELGVVRLNRAESLDDASRAIAEWRMPAVEFVLAGGEGVRAQVTAFEPRRQGFRGSLPAIGWSGRNEWNGFTRFEIAGAFRTPMALVVSANDDPIRASALSRALRGRTLTVADALQVQRDVHAAAADRLLPELEPLTIADPVVAGAQRRLLGWDRRIDSSEDARLFVAWEQAVGRAEAVRHRLSPELADAAVERWPSLAVRIAMTRRPDLSPARRTLLVSALAEAVASTTVPESAVAWRARHQVTFAHPLAISDDARGRFNVGPFEMDGYDSTVQAISDDGRVGPSLRVVFDLSDWDAAQVIDAPGQSGWADSPHYKDLAGLWAEGKTVPLAFTPAAVQRAAKATLTLQPK
jgi:penicillin amidase